MIEKVSPCCKRGLSYHRINKSTGEECIMGPVEFFQRLWERGPYHGTTELQEGQDRVLATGRPERFETKWAWFEIRAND